MVRNKSTHVIMPAPATSVEAKTKCQEAIMESSSVPMKHPLERTWTFWMYTNQRRNKWEENLVQLANFDTVEDYWCLYHYMKQPSDLALGQDYAVFKEGVRPMWEDEVNRNGGRWLINLEKRRRDADWMWVDSVLLMIGENFENSKDISGIVVNIRGKMNKIGLWTTDAQNREANEEIGRKLKNQLAIQGNIIYQMHNSTKNLYVV